MSSEQLADGVNPLDAELAATWDVLKGYSGRDTDLGIGRRFGGASMAFSLRDVGAMNGRVVKARRDVYGQGSDPEEDFSANQVSSGALEDWVNGKLESTLPADVATAAAAYSLRKVKSSYSGSAIRIRRNTDLIEVDVAFDADGKVSASSAVTNVAEPFGIERGSTSETTLGGFITEGGTNYDAFVVTWYDQSGNSKDAFQLTSANQPQIASSGALLADGITFDGSDDFLQTSSQVLTNTYTGARSLYGVCKINTDSGYIFGDAGSGTDEGTSFYSDTASDKIFFTNGKSGTLTTFDNITTIEGRNFLISSNYDNNNATTIHKNSNNNGYTQGTGSYNFTTSSKFTIGDREGGSSAATKLDGSVQEIIAYNSDQSDNRFKIESNINNYYNLYNDEYEWDDAVNTEWQNNVTDGTTTFTANGKDGFTITATGENKSSFKYAITSPSTASNDYYKVSFNVNDPDGLFENAQLRLTATGAGATSQTISNGFNSMSLRTGANFEYMSINSDGGGSSKTATLSDFKISLIARDGFVETWYDQSGNGFDLKSQSADTQPFIVNNGGFTGGVYSPSRLNNSTKQYLEISDPDFDSTNITSSKFGWLAVMANMEENDGSQAGGVILGNTRNTQGFPAGSIGLTLSDTNPNGRMFVTNLKTSSTGDFIGAVDNDDLFTSETIGTAVVDGSSLSTFLNGTTGSGTFTDLTLTSNVHFKIFQSSDSSNNVYYQNAAQGFIKELMFMQGDAIDDIVTIRNEVNNHYNIF